MCAKCPSFKQLQFLRLCDGFYYYKPGSSPKLKKNLLINHFCAKNRSCPVILNQHGYYYIYSLYLFLVNWTIFHQPWTPFCCVKLSLTKKTPRIEYIMWGLPIGSKPSQNCGPIWKSSPLWGGENCPQDTKNTHPNRTNSWFHLKKMDPSFKEMFFPHLENQNMDFMWNILIFCDFKPPKP